MGSIRVWVYIVLLWCAVCVSMEEDVFIDPHDMVNPRRKILKEEGETPEEEKTLKINPKLPDIQPSISEDNTLLPDIEDIKKPADVKQDTPKECPNTDIGKHLLRSYVKSLLGHFELKRPSSGSQEYNMLLQLSVHDFEMLQKFVSEESKDLHTLHESAAILTDMIRSVSRSHLGTMGKISIWFEDKYGASIDAALKMVAVLLMASVFATLEMKLQMSWRQRFMKLIVLSFIVSIPMTWFELYKAEQIKQETVAMKDAPTECIKNNDSISENWLNAGFQFITSLVTLKEDKCQKYYEHVMIDPFLKVPPTKAVGVTFVRFFLSPLKDVGASLSSFIRELLIDLPLTLYPVAMAMVTVFLFLILFMTFGYSLRLPFFLSIEPSPYHAVTGGSSNQQAIEDNTKRLMEQMQTMQNALESRETQFTARMNDFERLQKTAIEYSAAINVPDAPMPTIPKVPAVSRQRTTTPISQESGDLVPLTVKPHDTKSPIPCSEAELESSTEDSERTINLPHGGQSPSRGRSSRLPLSKKNKTGEQLPTQISSAIDSSHTHVISPETVLSQETSSR